MINSIVIKSKNGLKSALRNIPEEVGEFFNIIFGGLAACIVIIALATIFKEKTSEEFVGLIDKLIEDINDIGIKLFYIGLFCSGLSLLGYRNFIEKIFGVTARSALEISRHTIGLCAGACLSSVFRNKFWPITTSDGVILLNVEANLIFMGIFISALTHGLHIGVDTVFEKYMNTKKDEDILLKSIVVPSFGLALIFISWGHLFAERNH